MLFKVEDVKSNDTDMIGLLKAAGAQYVDKRSNGGRLWVIGEQELSETVAKAKALGYTFRFKKRVAMQPRTNRVGG